MKTLMGARLNDMRPYESEGATFAQAAFRWVLASGKVDALLISMTGKEEIDEYVAASGEPALAARGPAPAGTLRRAAGPALLPARLRSLRRRLPRRRAHRRGAANPHVRRGLRRSGARAHGLRRAGQRRRGLRGLRRAAVPQRLPQRHSHRRVRPRCRAAAGLAGTRHDRAFSPTSCSCSRPGR